MYVFGCMKKIVKEKQEENQNPSDLYAQVLSVSIEGGGMDVFMHSVHRSMQVCKDMDMLMWGQNLTLDIFLNHSLPLFETGFLGEPGAHQFR